MIITNVHIYENMPFDEYIKLPGMSFSGINNNGGKIEPTKKMRFGSRVDAYLFTPHEYDGLDYSIVKPTALELKRFLGTAIDAGKPQLSVTADFIHEGFVLHYKGRPDLKLPNLILDLKVSELDPLKAISFFRYDWQISGYGKSLSCDRMMIMTINPKTKKITTIPIRMTLDWWEYQIKKHGLPNTL